MKGIALVLLGLFGFFIAWKMVVASRKGAAKEVGSLPQINNEYREQSSWANSIQMPQGKSGESAVVIEKENAGSFVAGAVVGHALSGSVDSSTGSNMPSMSGAE